MQSLNQTEEFIHKAQKLIDQDLTLNPVEGKSTSKDRKKMFIMLGDLLEGQLNYYRTKKSIKISEQVPFQKT